MRRTRDVDCLVGLAIVERRLIRPARVDPKHHDLASFVDSGRGSASATGRIQSRVLLAFQEISVGHAVRITVGTDDRARVVYRASSGTNRALWAGDGGKFSALVQESD